MPRTSKIRISSKDRQLIKQLNTSARRKKRRLNKLFGVDVPIEYAKIEDFATRKQFNQYVKSLKTFTDRSNFRYVKNDAGIVVSRETYNQAKKQQDIINKDNQKLLKKLETLEATDRGQKLGYSIKNSFWFMGDDRIATLKDKGKFNLNQFKTMNDLQARLRYLANRSDPNWLKKKNRIYKQNFLKAIKNQFGNDKDSEGYRLYNKVKRMSNKKFMEKYFAENIATIDYVYSDFEKYQHLKDLENVFGIKNPLTDQLLQESEELQYEKV